MQVINWIMSKPSFILDLFLMTFQVVILIETIKSPLWRSHRKTIECVKVMYCCVGMCAVLLFSTMLIDLITGFADHVDVRLRVLMLSFLALYSFISHQTIRVYNRRRIRKGIPPHADKRSPHTV